MAATCYPACVGLPGLKFVVLDTNKLRDEVVVQALIAEYRLSGQRVVLPWSHLYEQSKGGSAKGFDRGHVTIRAEPAAFMLAMPSSLIVQAEQHTRQPQYRLDAIEEPRNGEALRAFLADPRPTTDISGLRAHVEQMFHAIHRPGWADKLRNGGVTVDDPTLAKAIHKGLHATPPDRGPLRRAVLEFHRERNTERLIRMLLETNLLPPEDAAHLVSYPSMIALTVLTYFCLGVRWRYQTPKKEHEDNPAADTEAVIIALYGKGLITDDSIARDLEEDMRIVAGQIWP